MILHLCFTYGQIAVTLTLSPLNLRKIQVTFLINPAVGNSCTQHVAATDVLALCLADEIMDFGAGLGKAAAVAYQVMENWLRIFCREMGIEAGSVT